MKLFALPAFTDNCIRLLHDDAQAVVADPAEDAPASASLDADRLTLSTILVTRDDGIAADRAGHRPRIVSVASPFDEPVEARTARRP